MGRDGFTRPFGEDHALLGAVLDLADEVSDGAVKLLLLAERLAAAGAVGVDLVGRQRQEEVALFLVAAHHRVQGVRLGAGAEARAVLHRGGRVLGDRPGNHAGWRTAEITGFSAS
ncbi:hypothetical protein [Streptomyces sp. NPDC059092]|uniref:hypothetical protein n=1 Tax=Streptomyces sp. NPDC059092 TaxID=3346725 RepID=UPI0036A777AB